MNDGRPSLARFRQTPSSAPAYAVSVMRLDAPSEYGLAREPELCPDHGFFALGCWCLRGRMSPRLRAYGWWRLLRACLRIPVPERDASSPPPPPRRRRRRGRSGGRRGDYCRSRVLAEGLPPPVAGKQANWLNGSMALARGEAVREVAAGATRPGDVAQVLESAPALLMRLQRTAGNAAVCRLLAGAVLARQPAPAGAPTVAATVGSVGGKRPSSRRRRGVRRLQRRGRVAQLRRVHRRSAARLQTHRRQDPSKKLPDGTLEATVDITWAYDAASSAD